MARGKLLCMAIRMVFIVSFACASPLSPSSARGKIPVMQPAEMLGLAAAGAAAGAINAVAGGGTLVTFPVLIFRYAEDHRQCDEHACARHRHRREHLQPPAAGRRGEAVARALRARERARRAARQRPSHSHGRDGVWEACSVSHPLRDDPFSRAGRVPALRRIRGKGGGASASSRGMGRGDLPVRRLGTEATSARASASSCSHRSASSGCATSTR